MRRCLTSWSVLTLTLAAAAPPTFAAGAATRAATAVPRLTVTPGSFKLVGPEAEQQLLLSAPRGAAAVYVSLDPKVARVSPGGLVTPVADGVARVRVRWNGGVTDATAAVTLRNAPAPGFEKDIQPILARASCSSGTCHGKAEGQRGFRLSLFGYDPELDYESITRGASGRRVTKLQPERSLLLLKATSAIPHAGGARIITGSRDYRALVRWIASGAPLAAPGEAALSGIQVFPAAKSLSTDASQQIIVTAKYADGSMRDVTREARYASNNPAILEVDTEGIAQSRKIPGAAAVMVSYRGLVATSRLLIPRSGAVPVPTPPRSASYIDRLVWERFVDLRIQPSAPATDSVFIRRAYLDLIGTLPTADEVREFLAECDAERKGPAAGGQRPGGNGATGARAVTPSIAPALRARAQLVDRLLQRPEYADFWALKWADLLRVSKSDLGAKGAYGFYSWIRESLAENKPYDQFVREIVTASGSSSENGPTNLYRVLHKPEEAASSVSQVFLGVRIECAQCHHHPFEKWSQDDYYGMVGFFAPLKSKPDGPHSVRITAGPPVVVKHPRTGEAVAPHPLAADPADFDGEGDRRRFLADWMASPQNHFVPRALVNRLWAHFLGKGLVDPVDDFRDTNPPSNPELLDALAKDFVSGGYDMKRLTRAIMTSQVYQLSSTSNPTNAGDEQNYSRAYPKRLQAEVLLDAVASATGTAPELTGLPRGTRAIQVWDSEWATQWQSYFLNVFGRPERAHPCECERSQEPSIVQVLHLMNAPEIQRQISHRQGRARALAESARTPEQIVDELFLSAYARLPSAKEKADSLKAFTDGADRTRATEDILWALMNTMEFVFNH